MANPAGLTKRNRFLRRDFLVIGCCLCACLVPALCLGWYLFEPDPVSPPATQLGAEPGFDAISATANRERLFLFRAENKILATDIYGNSDNVILDIKSTTNNEASELLGPESISPDGRRLAVTYFTERDTSGYWHPPIGKLMVVDLSDGTFENITVSLEGFNFDWVSPVTWLSPTVFLVRMQRFLGANSDSEQDAFLRYNLRELSDVQSYLFDPCRLAGVVKPHSTVLLLGSSCVSRDDQTIWAIDKIGKRLAASDEVTYYKKFFDCYGKASCVQELDVGTVPVIQTASVVGNSLDGIAECVKGLWTPVGRVYCSWAVSWELFLSTYIAKGGILVSSRHSIESSLEPSGL